MILKNTAVSGEYSNSCGENFTPSAKPEDFLSENI